MVDWEAPVIATQMLEALQQNNFVDETGKSLTSFTLGFSSGGKTAFVIIGYKSKSVIKVYVENDNRQISIKAGLLPEHAKSAQYQKIFKHTELKQASEYFEMLLNTIGITNE